METNKLLMDIGSLFSGFKDHIDIKNNNRIFFSGKFGTGKTYFLDNFFTLEKEQYEVFHLYPINYQISSNEDILEYIKYDLISLLYERDSSLFTENDYNNIVDTQRLLYIWMTWKKKEIVKAGANLTTDILSVKTAGLSNALWYLLGLWKSSEKIIDLADDFIKYQGKANKGELWEIKDYLDKIKQKWVGDTDYIASLIKEKIGIRKDKKESILILDDLERIDPEHIFRLLNIFSAHLDGKSFEGWIKFGFDKIILVWDINNLKSIYHHKYWEECDFDGYMDKFYSVDVYHYENERIIEGFIKEIVKQFKHNREVYWQTLSDGTGRYFLEDILIRTNRLKKSMKLNMRELLKCHKFSLPVLSKAHRNDTNQAKYNFDLGIKVLITIFAGPNNLINRLKEIRDNDPILGKILSKAQYRHICYLFFRWWYIDKNKSSNGLEITPNSVDRTTSKLFWDYTLTIEWADHGRYNISQVVCNYSNKNFEQLDASEKIIYIYLSILIEYIKNNQYDKEEEYD